MPPTTVQRNDNTKKPEVSTKHSHKLLRAESTLRWEKEELDQQEQEMKAQMAFLCDPQFANTAPIINIHSNSPTLRRDDSVNSNDSIATSPSMKDREIAEDVAIELNIAIFIGYCGHKMKEYKKQKNGNRRNSLLQAVSGGHISQSWDDIDTKKCIRIVFKDIFQAPSVSMSNENNHALQRCDTMDLWGVKKVCCYLLINVF